LKEPIIFRRPDCLDYEQALYWKDLLYRTIKIGTELEYAFPKGAKKNDILQILNKQLEPSGDLNHLGPYGVLDVVSEHCGFEIRVIGRQPYYEKLLEQYRYILDKLVNFKVRARFTCGLHYHLLAIGLSESMPEIILANMWNLFRLYAPNLKFLTSSGDKMETLCRRRNHNSHKEMVKLTPNVMSMKEIKQHLKKSKIVPEHQNFFNLQHVKFSADGQVKDFHIELRFPDADLSPTSIVAKTFLFLSMLLKAVEISQYGLLHVGTISEWRRKVELMDMLSNNDGTLAASDTAKINNEIIEELRVGNRELLELLKPIFSRFDNNPCSEILSFLAENPISLLRIKGLSWPEIEKTLQEHAVIESYEWDEIDKKLIRCIELALITRQKSMHDWKQYIAWNHFLTSQELEKRLANYNLWRGLWWDGSLGTISFLT
jgi:hypothetical protein